MRGPEVPIEGSRNIGGATALLLVAVAAGAWFGVRGAATDVPVEPSRGLVVDVPSSEESITVHVSGAVAAPGLVSLRPGARVADALAAAGGAAPRADLAGVNLAAPVEDGGQIVIPEVGAGHAGAPERAEGVRVNVASEQELQALPGVGPVLAARIVAHREQYGSFGSVEDLLDVPGIGEATLAEMRDEIILP